MATSCSSTGALSLLLLLLLLLPAASLVHGAGDDVKTACAETKYPEYCTSVLSTSPESAAADARGLAEIAVRAAAKAGAAAATLARAEQKGMNMKDDPWWCMGSCAEDMEAAASLLGGRGGGGASLADVGRLIEGTEGEAVEWNCDECRYGSSKKKSDLISKENDFAKMMAIVSALIKRVRATRGATATPAPVPAPSPY